MKEIRSILCKYENAGDFCHYWKEIKVIDGHKLYICSYLGDKYPCDEEEE